MVKSLGWCCVLHVEDTPKPAMCCTSRGSAADQAAIKLPLWRMLVFVAPNVPLALMNYVRGALITVFYVNYVGVSLFDIALARFFAGAAVKVQLQCTTHCPPRHVALPRHFGALRTSSRGLLE